MNIKVLSLGFLFAYLKAGGKLKSKIHIKKKNKGKFTEAANRAGMSVQQYAKKVLSDPNASTTLKKRANFARNAATWKRSNGGHLITVNK